jgi:hypothetical protein
MKVVMVIHPPALLSNPWAPASRAVCAAENALNLSYNLFAVHTALYKHPLSLARLTPRPSMAVGGLGGYKRLRRGRVTSDITGLEEGFPSRSRNFFPVCAMTSRAIHLKFPTACAPENEINLCTNG